ncbi:autotransporter adhesin, partial [Bibersteinia trehalosi]|uniref:YadA family autotransporter adhesin n=1 Tax=Bibersteinia trehalosi TaxID=47735 RepID=UPI0010D05C20
TTLTGGNTTVNLGNGTVNVNNSTISHVAPGVNGTDAVNVDQLEKVNATANAGWTISTNTGDKSYVVKPNATVDLRNADGNIVISQENGNITFGLNSTLSVGGKDGKDGQISAKGADGKDGVSIYGNGTIGINGKDSVNASMTVAEGKHGLDGKDGETMTRVVYTDANGTTHEIATLDDGLKFKGDTGNEIAKKLGETLEILGRASVNAAVTDKNLRIDNENGVLVVRMARELQEINSISNNNGTTITLGDADNRNVVNVNNATVTNVANATNATDAVNLQQLNASRTAVENGNHVRVSTTTNADGSTNYIVNANHTAVEAGNNVNLASSTDGNGLTTYNVSVEGDLTNITSISNANTTISLGNNSVDVGGATITNVSNATNGTDAVNLNQLNASRSYVQAGNYTSVTSTTNTDGSTTYTVNAEKSVVEAGTNVNVATTTSGDGLTTYKVSVEGDLSNISSISNGNTSISLNDGTINVNNATITNVKAGVNGTDAVNVDQLEKVNATANAGWNITTNNATDSHNVKPNTAVDLNNGDGNIVITQNAGNITFDLASNLTNISNIGNGNGTNISLNDGDISVNNATISNVANGTNASDAVNLSQLKASRSGVEAGNYTTVTSTTNADGSTVYTVNAEKTVVEAGNNIAITSTTTAKGLTTYTVGVTTGDISPTTNGSVIANTTNGNIATVGDIANAINNSGWNIALTDGSSELINPGDMVNFVNGSGTTATVNKNNRGGVDISFNVNTANAPTINQNGSVAMPADGSGYVNATTLAQTVNSIAWNVNSTVVEGSTGKVTEGSDTTASQVKAGNTVNVNAGNNIEITRNGNNIAIATSMDPVFNTVQIGGNNGVKLSVNTAEDGVKELSVGTIDAPTRITNVAPGQNGTDAVNVNQLKGAIGNVNNHINKVDKNLRAGIAGATATAGLYHATLPGKSMVSAGAGTFKGESALAVGYSRLSDNGKIGVKFSLNTNTRGDTGAAASVGYQW